MPALKDYIRSDTAKLVTEWKDKKTGKTKSKTIELLWGDEVRVLGNGRTAKEKKVRARAITGFVDNKDLGGDPLLEIYFIDVGQGDGVLICTPDRKHLMIDGGYARAKQPTGKNAADFVDWKFVKDYGKTNIQLDAMICSHNDNDHYGGLWDLLSEDPAAVAELNAKGISVENFYHAGLSWWTIAGKRTLGKPVQTDNGAFYTNLIDNRNSVTKGLKKQGSKPQLQGEWATFLAAALKARTKAGKPTPFKRISSEQEFLPGYFPEDGKPSIRVLAPVEFDVSGKPGIRNYGSTASKNTNGNSLLFRLDYGRARILLTGDLNKKSMQALLEDWEGQRQEFACDVAKACHHGSADVSYEFLQAINAAVTVISSGDNESHDHPRPSIVAASATTGYLRIERDELISPLIYSTELARSLKLGDPTNVLAPTPDGSIDISGADLKKTIVTAKSTNAGDLKPKTIKRNLQDSHIVSGVIYGLVNVRTDGEKILCATMNEKNHKWIVHNIVSRF